MLEGIGRNDIIVDAYTSQDGVCPMLAAHRAGGRTDLISFAGAWDRFVGGGRRAHGRRASVHELRILLTQLQASLDEAEASHGLAAAIAGHRELVTRHAPSPGEQRRRRGDPDRARELRDRPGWAWMRVVRRHDDYERTLEQLGSQRSTTSAGERESAGFRGSS